VVVAWEAGVDTAFSNLTNMLEMLLEGLEAGRKGVKGTIPQGSSIDQP